jgi:hypothetical protein
LGFFWHEWATFKTRVKRGGSHRRKFSNSDSVEQKKKNGKILKFLGPVYRSELKYLIEIKINSLRDWLNFGEQPIRNLDFEFNRD